jgi:hypothetical protein
LCHALCVTLLVEWFIALRPLGSAKEPLVGGKANP